MNPLTLNVRDFRNQLADSVNRVSYIKQPLLVTKHGRPVAALVSVDDYERVINPRTRFSTQADWDKGFQVIDRIRSVNEDKTNREIESLVSQAISKVRDQSRN